MAEGIVYVRQTDSGYWRYQAIDSGGEAYFAHPQEVWSTKRKAKLAGQKRLQKEDTQKGLKTDWHL